MIKELILSTVVKDVQKAKIELAWQSLLEQRTFFPVYPGNPITPIEWAQYKQMMFESTPDILLIPSDLMLYARVSIFKLMTRCRMWKAVFALTQACWLRVKHMEATLTSRSIIGKAANQAKRKVTKQGREYASMSLIFD